MTLPTAHGRRALVAWFTAITAMVAAGTEASSAAIPSNLSPPTIIGIAVAGETLLVSTGSWAGTPPLSFSVTWERCDAAGMSCSAIPGGTGQSHLVDTADVGSTLRARETATNADGSESAQSPPTAVVTAQAAPVNVTEPSISGSPIEGSTLSTSTGAWSGGSLTYAYQWVRCPVGGGLPDGSDCPPIPGATSSSYTVGAADIGRRLRVQVAASNATGSATATANATDIVQPSTTTGPPRNLLEPSIDGTLSAGRLLIASAGTWAGEALSYAYQWVRCGPDGGLPDGSNCTFIAGATSPVYTLAADDVGERIRIRVTASNGLGVQTAASNASPPITATSIESPPVQAPRNSVLPTILGSPRVAGTVTASVGFWTGTSPLLYSYQWLRCGTDGGGDPDGVGCTAIAGATGAQYVPGSADLGQRLRVQVTARNTLAAVTATSSATTTVLAAGMTPPPPTTSPPSVTVLPAGAVRLADGKISIPVTSVSLPNHLVATNVVFTPGHLSLRASRLELRVRVLDTRGYVVRNALVLVRSSPLVTSAAREVRTARDGWVRFKMTLKADLPLGGGHKVRFLIRVRKPSDGLLQGVSSRRIVQVATAS